ncbi:MAG: nucleotidyl transferase AbiEii/AbiGii toxin family protein [Patescibacteria group bacterium]
MEKKMGFDLNPLQKIILKIIGDSPLSAKFYWTGGTPLAYFYLKHRRSFDLDFFSDKEFTYQEILPTIQKIAKKLNLKRLEEKRVFDRWEFFLYNKEKIRIEFAYYEFANLKPWKKWQKIYVDSFDDMAANKTMALIDRHEPKDVFDVYFLIKKKGILPERLLKLVKKKFKIDFPLSLFLSQTLVAAQQLPKIKPLLVDRQQNIFKEIINYFEEKSAKFIKNSLNL